MAENSINNSIQESVHGTPLREDIDESIPEGKLTPQGHSDYEDDEILDTLSK